MILTNDNILIFHLGFATGYETVGESMRGKKASEIPILRLTKYLKCLILQLLLELEFSAH